MSNPLPGDGFLGWIGRQFGYVKKALQTDVTAKPSKNEDISADKTESVSDSREKQASSANGSAVIYRNDRIEELPHPKQPNVKLRRTTIDEVIVEKQSDRQDEQA